MPGCLAEPFEGWPKPINGKLRFITMDYQVNRGFEHFTLPYTLVALRHEQAQLREFVKTEASAGEQPPEDQAPEMNVYSVLPLLAVHDESEHVVIRRWRGGAVAEMTFYNTIPCGVCGSRTFYCVARNTT